METLLKQIGLNDKEIKVYLAIQQYGKITPAEIAKLTGINRTTVYSTAKELMRLGIVTEDLGSSPRYLLALPAAELEKVIVREEKRLEAKKQVVGQAISELKAFTKQTKYSIPKITFITEEKVEDYLYKRTEEWIKSIKERGENTAWGFQDTSLVSRYEDWINWYWRNANPKDMTWKLLTNQADIESTMKKRNYTQRNIKLWDGKGAFSASTWVCGDYLIMIATQQRPHYLVEIHDAVLAQNMRELFKAIWSTV